MFWLFRLERRTKNSIMPTMKAITNTPPITPPTMAPTGVDLEPPLEPPLEFPLEEVVEGSREEFVGT